MQLMRLMQIGVVTGALLTAGVAASGNVDLPDRASDVARQAVAHVTGAMGPKAEDQDRDRDDRSATTAGKPADGTRPGWGCGDDNHKHTGPRGNTDAKSPCPK